MATATHTWLPDFPSLELTLALEPEELALHLLRLARRREQNGLFLGEDLFQAILTPPHEHQHARLSPDRRPELEIVLSEALQWLRFQLLVVPESGTNGTNGWMRIARRGQRLLADPESFEAFRRGIAFPKELLHPAIAAKVWIRLARGEFDDAVFAGFKAVEEAVRKASNYDHARHGIPMFRAAFHPEKGPLTNMEDEAGERQALSDLFVGAYGTQRNPTSHRSVAIDAGDAQAMVMLASYLLRIVDSRAINKEGGNP